ncbi:hypothetical protein [Herbaspirillum sp. YR522]|uniref:hypothetical protein n=1 Tax=Herbaspirillum sp. YR522 TaxID=1144342 RepID=UPI00026FA29D|nr:hypothetical protein [Herbaspirillum sp. YR522]EJN06463.1 hypothetical protein PMI40_02249 [Herbaspirillum sp. YR522]
MKFKKTTFTAAFEDGLLEMEGYAFDVGARLLIAHRRRPEVADLFRDYQVSERTTGFSVLIPQSFTRTAAATHAIEVMDRTSDSKWNEAIHAAAKRLRKLKPIQR